MIGIKRMQCVAVLVLCVLLAAVPAAGYGETREEVGVHAGGCAVRQQVQLSFRLQAGASLRVFRGLPPQDELVADSGKYMLEEAQAGEMLTYWISAAGAYTYYKVVCITEEDIRTGRKEIVCTTDRKSGTGFEAGTVFCWPDPFVDKVLGIADLREPNQAVRKTPAFTQTGAAHQFTSVSQGRAYLEKLSRENSCVHLYSLAEDGVCPAVVLTETNLSRAETLQDAVDAIKSNGKLKVLYQAQIHGNEPGAGEGALAVCGGLVDARNLLEQMDVVIVPYANPDGAAAFTRGNGNGININRDAIRLRTGEARYLHRLYSSLVPEVLIDGHEYTFRQMLKKEGVGYAVSGCDDVKLAYMEHLNRDRSVCGLEQSIGDRTVKELTEKGFRTFFFDPNWDSTTSANYARMQNSLAFLVETPGIGSGRQGFCRRVRAQYETVMSILKQTAAEGEHIQRTTERARNRLVHRGRIFSTSDRFVLTHRVDRDRPTLLQRSIYNLSGHLMESRIEKGFNRAVRVKTRSRPTAYVIPCSAAGAGKVAEILGNNGVSWLKLRPGVRLTVSQYIGDTGKAKIGKKKKIRFTKGAYVFYMSQSAANLLSASLEPDAGDTADGRGNLLQSGVLKKSGRGWPLYRYTGKNPERRLLKYGTKKTGEVILK